MCWWAAGFVILLSFFYHITGSSFYSRPASPLRFPLPLTLLGDARLQIKVCAHEKHRAGLSKMEDIVKRLEGIYNIIKLKYKVSCHGLQLQSPWIIPAAAVS